MSNTGTVTRAPHDVSYGLRAVEDMPEPTKTGRRSQISDLLNQIKDDEANHNRAFCIADYRVGNTASAAAGTLKAKHGNTPAVEGWTFGIKKLDNGRTGLFAKYEPARIDPEGRANFDAEVAAAKQRREENAAKREAEKAKAASNVKPMAKAASK